MNIYSVTDELVKQPLNVCLVDDKEYLYFFYDFKPKITLSFLLILNSGGQLAQRLRWYLMFIAIPRIDVSVTFEIQTL